MAFVPGYKHDVFISYARVNDEPPEGTERGWVSTFVNGLRRELAQRLGHLDAYSLWRDHELAGNISITPEIMDSLHHSATLVVVFSQGYLASPWCQREKSEFLDAVQEQRSRTDSRVFVIELDKTERPPEFGDLRGYRFFEEDPGTRYPRTLGWPQPQPNDREYYNTIITLSYDLAEELRRLKASTNEERLPESETLATVLLAEETGDLYFVREGVKGYLEQANIKVLPEKKKNYPREPDAFQNAVRNDLAKSDLFVQLLSAVPFKRFPDMPQGYVYCQYELAQEAGIEILQWKSPDLDVSTIQDPGQRDFLQGKNVYVGGIEAFKAEIKGKLLSQQKTVVSQKASPPLVFINKHSNDTALAEEICRMLKEKFHVDYSNPEPSAQSKIVERWMLKCNGAIVIYGNVTPEWVETQCLDMLDFTEQKRTEPFAACGIYDGPPEDKQELRFNLSEFLVLKCRERLKEEEIRKFVNALHLGEIT